MAVLQGYRNPDMTVSTPHGVFTIVRKDTVAISVIKIKRQVRHHRKLCEIGELSHLEHRKIPPSGYFLRFPTWAEHVASYALDGIQLELQAATQTALQRIVRDRIVEIGTDYIFKTDDDGDKARYWLYRKSLGEPLRDECVRGWSGDEHTEQTAMAEAESYIANSVRILVEYQKHGEVYYDISTNEKFKTAVLYVIASRFENGYYQLHDPPSDPEIDLKTIPDSLKTSAKRRLDEYKSALRDYHREKATYDFVKTAIANNDAAIAWDVLDSRSNYEYERVEIIVPIDPRHVR